MCGAACMGNVEALRHLLAAAPELATATDADGRTPLFYAASNVRTDAVHMLLAAAPAAALVADKYNTVPLHAAAQAAGENLVRLLLAAEPAAALLGDRLGKLPLYYAAQRGNCAIVRLLLDAAPAAASFRANLQSFLPLEEAIDQAATYRDHHLHAFATHFLQVARLLLRATPPDDALAALAVNGELTLPLFADLAACRPLSPEQWQRMPVPCPGLGAALPAVLARSEAEAGLLVQRLPAEEQHRLRTAALALGRAQRELGVALEPALVGRVLALAAAAP